MWRCSGCLLQIFLAVFFISTLSEGLERFQDRNRFRAGRGWKPNTSHVALVLQVLAVSISGTPEGPSQHHSRLRFVTGCG